MKEKRTQQFESVSLVQTNDKQPMEGKRTYLESVHYYGRIWGLALCALILAIPFVIAVLFQAKPDFSALLAGTLAILPMYWAVGFVEMFTYVPMLGAGGAYLSFVTGNISNLKLPCALDAMNRAGVKASDEEAS